MTTVGILTTFFSLVGRSLHSTAIGPHFPERREPLALGAVQAVVASLPQHRCPVLLLMNNANHITLRFLKEMARMQAAEGVVAFQVAACNLNVNTTQTQLRATVDRIRQMGQLWHCLLLVVGSDDPTFLAAFTLLSLKRHALKWSTRILVLTRLPLQKLSDLHGLLSKRNAMLLLATEEKQSMSNSSVGVYVTLPYSSPTTPPRKVATWTPNKNWTRNSLNLFFPEKFSVFSLAPTLTVAIEVLPYHTISRVEDKDDPQGYRLVFKGYMEKTLRYFAKAMNFTYRYVVSPERTFGTKLPDGSWTGMMGMVVREEVDIGAGPFILSTVRAEAADHILATWIGNLKIVSGLGSLKVDPWGFLMPLTPLVWVATLTALLGMLAVTLLVPFCLPGGALRRSCWPVNAFSYVRVILQQDVVVPAEWLWWERVMLGLWMQTTLVITKSFAGNLMSLLAVKYVPQPFQTPRDVLNDPHVAMIWQKYSSNEQFLREVQSGVFREVAELEEKGRLFFHKQAQFQASLDTLVRAGDHVLVDTEMALRTLVALDVSLKG